MPNLSPEQQTKLRQDITVTRAGMVYLGQSLLTWWNTGQDGPLAAFYSEVYAPDFWVWRTDATKRLLFFEPSATGSTFNYAGNGMITRSVQELLVLDFLLGPNEVMSMALHRNRQALNDIFSGTGNAQANQTHLMAAGRRKALVGEQLYSVASQAPPVPSGALGSLTAIATLGYEGVISPGDIAECRNV